MNLFKSIVQYNPNIKSDCSIQNNVFQYSHLKIIFKEYYKNSISNTDFLNGLFAGILGRQPGSKLIKKCTLHSNYDLPADICSNGIIIWYKYGLRHRDRDLPARMDEDGSLYWFKNGKMFRENDKIDHYFPDRNQKN